MTTLTTNDISYLNPRNFTVTFATEQFKNIDFYVKTANIPDVNTGTLEQSFTNQTLPLPGNNMTWGELSITFLVDEEMSNYKAIFDWLLKAQTDDTFALDNNDIILTVFTAQGNRVYDFIFTNCFPSDVTSLTFETTTPDDVPLECTVTFKYDYFSIK